VYKENNPVFKQKKTKACCWLMQYLLVRRECPIRTGPLLKTCFSADSRLEDFAATNILLHMIVQDFVVQVHGTYVSATFEHVPPLVDFVLYNGCLYNSEKYNMVGFTKTT
jgi:hypothetical protein